MDGIANLLYSICCLLPFLAFILLVKQIYRGKSLRKTTNTPFIFLQKGYLQSEDITIVMSQIQEETIHKNQRKFKAVSLQSTKLCQYQQSCLEQAQTQNLCNRNAPISHCSAGIARMNSINKKYLNSKVIGNIDAYLQQMYRNRNKLKKNKKEQLFESTFLPTIIEGLRY